MFLGIFSDFNFHWNLSRTNRVCIKLLRFQIQFALKYFLLFEILKLAADGVHNSGSLPKYKVHTISFSDLKTT